MNNIPLTNLFAVEISVGETFTFPDGFMTASVTPNSSTSTFTITNSQGNVTPTYGFQINFPITNNRGYAVHTVECMAGSVIISYYK